MKKIHLFFFLKLLLPAFFLFHVFSVVRADNRQFYYDVRGDGTIAYFSNFTGYSDVFYNWFNFNNDRYVDAYMIYGVWQGNSSYAFDNGNWTNMYVGHYGTPNLQAIDFNNDGRADLKTNWPNDPEEVMVYVRGQWFPTLMPQISPEAYRGEQEKLSLYSSAGMGSAVSFVYGNDGAAMRVSGTQAIDIDGDGYTDFVDAVSGTFYQNVGDGRFVLNKGGGRFTFRDFNGDGVTDYVLFDSDKKRTSLFLSQTDGTWKEQLLVSNLYIDPEVFCYDYDKDGDVDILLTLSYYVHFGTNSGNKYTHDNGGSFLLLLENKGGGSFIQHEFSLDGVLYFRQCVDLDGDGCYEIVAQKQNGDKYQESDLVYYKLKDMNVDDTPVLLKKEAGDLNFRHELDYIVKYNCLLADLDHSGYVRVLHNGSVCENLIPNARPNTRPASPGKPRYVYDAAKGTLRVEWDEGSDAECSSADLTYALRIGSDSEEGDMFFAHALPDGRRRNLEEGNCGFSRLRTLNVSSWPAGTYYISVQSVDPGCLGSEFSPYAVFEKKEPAADFLLSRSKFFSIGDTCKVVLLGDVEEGCTYEWNWDGATVLSSSADGSEYEIKFTAGGEKHISLKTTAPSGAFARVEHSLDVIGGNVKNHDFGESSISRVLAAVDIDEDGNAELLLENNNNYRFYEGDEHAQYTTVKKIWNSSLPSVSWFNSLVADVNRDGKADVLNYNFNQPYLLANEGNGQMMLRELNVEAFNADFYDSRNYGWRDYNNDGLLEPYGYRNLGDYTAFEDLKNKFAAMTNALIPVDYDKDGLIDFVGIDSYETETRNVVLFRNNGDFSFTSEKLEWIDWDGTTFGTIEDLDGDGLWDFIGSDYDSWAGFTRYSEDIRIQWGDGKTSVIPAENGVAFGELYKIADVDNNGCLDLIFGTNSSFQSVVVYFHKDRSYEIGTTELIDINAGVDFLLTDGRRAVGQAVFSEVANCKPAAPEQIRASQDEKFVTIEWNHSADAETPAALMRYNISVRRKGATGDGAYIFSPLNSTKNGVHVPSSASLLEWSVVNTMGVMSSPCPLIAGNRFRIPVQNIPAGEYEVQVQGVDSYMQESDFSEVYNLTVAETSMIEMPASTGVGCEVQVKITDNSGQLVGFGSDATVKDNADGSYSVIWNSEGLKTVSVGSSASQDIYVYPVPQGALSLPETVLQDARVAFEGENMERSVWTYSLDGASPCDVKDASSLVKVEVLDNSHAVVTFGKSGRYELFHSVVDDFNMETYSAQTTVDASNNRPAITIVDIEPESGRYRLNWSAGNLPEGTQNILVYKETSRYDEYELLATLPVSETSYVDSTSMPDCSASRYRLVCSLPYGETAPSVEHQPVHVMISKGLGNTWNLVWTRYEGRDIASYRILGGVSPDDLRTIAEVSGHQISYSDLDAASDMAYYAVEMIPASVQAVKKAARATDATVCRSNVVSITDAFSPILAKQITVLSDKENMTIDGSAGETSIQLMANIYPLNATVQRLNWQVVDGNDIAVVGTSGLLTAFGDGTVTVRACTVDGSGVYGEVQVRTSGLVSVKQIERENDGAELKASFSEGRLTILGLPADEEAVLYVYNTDGCLMAAGKGYGSPATMECGNLAAGVYICRAVTKTCKGTVRFLKP